MRDRRGEHSPNSERFGRYEVVRPLGRGAMGEVLEGRHVDLDTRVAIKVLHPGAAEEEGALGRALREGRALAAIRHPHVVSVLDIGVEGRRPFLVMELLEGEDLAKRLARQGPMGVEEAADCLLAVVSGVAAAHGATVVHRDLKPSNVFVARRLAGVEPVVIDFGISKAPRAVAGATTSAHAIAGTPLYMAPEQLRGGEATCRSDQYALGVVLYECVTGSPPFFHEDHYELLHAIMTAPVVPPSELHPLVPPAFDAVVLRALARDPAVRFPSVHALGRALLPFGSENGRRRWLATSGDTRDSGGCFEVATPVPVETATPRVRVPRSFWVALGALASGAILLAYVATARSRALAERAPSSPRPVETEAPAPATPAQAIAMISPDPGASRPAGSARAEGPPPAVARPDRGGASPRAPSRLPVAPSWPQAPRSVVPAPSTHAAAQVPVERGTHNIPILE